MSTHTHDTPINNQTTHMLGKKIKTNRLPLDKQPSAPALPEGPEPLGVAGEGHFVHLFWVDCYVF